MQSELTRYKIIYLVGGPLTERWLSYYRLDTIHKFFDVEYWDCSDILKNPYTVVNPIERPYVYRITSLRMISNRLSDKPAKTIIVPEIGFHKANYKIFKRIAQYVCNCVIIDIWTFPLLHLYNAPNSNNKNLIKKKGIKQSLYRFTPIRLFAKFIKYGPTLKYLSYIKEEYNLLKSKRYIYWEKKCKDLFNIQQITYGQEVPNSINHPDYEKYISLQNSEPFLSGDYIVFIGQYLPYHADLLTDNPELANQVEKIAMSYYSALNRFFEKIEQVSGCEVVIAEHPSGVHKNNPFNGRKIFYYRTAELVKDAKAVCMHSSNSLNFVVLNNKPVAFLECAALYTMSGIVSDVRNYSRMVGLTSLDIESITNVDCAVFKLIDENLREKYVQSMRGRPQGKTNDELFVSCFKSLFLEIP